MQRHVTSHLYFWVLASALYLEIIRTWKIHDVWVCSFKKKFNNHLFLVSQNVSPHSDKTYMSFLFTKRNWKLIFSSILAKHQSIRYMIARFVIIWLRLRWNFFISWTREKENWYWKNKRIDGQESTFLETFKIYFGISWAIKKVWRRWWVESVTQYELVLSFYCWFVFEFIDEIYTSSTQTNLS